MNDCVLDISEVAFAWRRGEMALDGIDLRVAAGEAVGLLGRNGAGKTTLLRTILGLIAPQRGAVKVFGLDPMANGVEVRKRIGFVPEDCEFPDSMFALDVLRLHRSLFPTWDRDYEDHLRGHFDIPGAKRIGSLSKGQARQLALLCAMAHRPQLLMLDEPGSGIDPAVRREFHELVVAMRNRDECALLFSSHHVQDLERMSDRVAVIDEGRLLFDELQAEIHESFCVVVIHDDSGGEAQRCLSADAACLRARVRGDQLRAVFRGNVDEVEQHLRGVSAYAGSFCSASSLEDLFVDLVGKAS